MVTELRIGRVDVHKGDTVRVRPSKPHKRDGFTARFVGAEVRDGVVAHVQVYGAPLRRAPLMRFLAPDRVIGMRQTERRR